MSFIKVTYQEIIDGNYGIKLPIDIFNDQKVKMGSLNKNNNGILLTDDYNGRVTNTKIPPTLYSKHVYVKKGTIPLDFITQEKYQEIYPPSDDDDDDENDKSPPHNLSNLGGASKKNRTHKKKSKRPTKRSTKRNKKTRRRHRK